MGYLIRVRDQEEGPYPLPQLIDRVVRSDLPLDIPCREEGDPHCLPLWRQVRSAQRNNPSSPGAKADSPYRVGGTSIALQPVDDEHDKVGMVLFATELALSREVLGPGQIFTAMLILRSELDLGGLNNASTEYLASISKRLTAMAHHTSNESDLDDKRAKRIGGLSLAALGIAGLMAKAAIETPALTLTIGSYAFGMALLIAVLMTYKLTRDASAYEKASAELKAVAGLLDSLCAKRHKTAAVPRVGTLLYPLPNGAFTTTPPSTAPVSPLHLSVEAAFLESQLTSQSQTSLLVQKSTLGSFETAHAQPAVRVAAKATLGAAVKSILEKQAAASSKPASTGEPPEPTVDRVRGSETAPTEADGVDNELDLLPEEPERHRLKK